MVNQGRTARGCHSCKKRKIKCDLTHPSCRRCINSGRRCPGVPNQVDFVFRNQILTATGQLKGWMRPVPRNSSVGMDTLPVAHEPVQEQRCEPQGIRMPTQLHLSDETVAITLFFQHYTAPKNSKFWKSYMDILRPLYLVAPVHSAIHQTTIALATAILSHLTRETNLRQKADLLYTTALRSLNAALRHPLQSKTNETLMCVLLLCIYENTSRSDWFSKNLRNHSNGAVALTLHRGMEQFNDFVSLRLFRAVRTHYIFQSIRNATSIPDSPSGAFWTADEVAHPDHIRNLYLHAINITTMRSRAHRFLKPGADAKVEDIHQLLIDCQKIDIQLIDWFDELPNNLGYHSIPYLSRHPEDIEKASTWPGVQLYYPDRYIASVCNNYYCFRIYVQDIIRKCIAKLDIRYETASKKMLSQAALFITKGMVDNICGSVPFGLGIDLDIHTRSCSGPHVSEDEGNALPKKLSEASGAFWLLRPLSIAASVDCVPEIQRQWLLGRLKAIRNEYGFSSADYFCL